MNSFSVFYSRLKAYGMAHEHFTLFVGACAVMGAFLLMMVVNLTLMNTQASKGYVLRELEQERQALMTDGEVTEMMILQASSMHYLQEAPAVQGMRRPQKDDLVFVAPVSVFAQK